VSVFAIVLLAVAADVQVGSKKFTESVILGEIAAQVVRSEGVAATHRRELGGTRIVFEALRSGEIDAYVEYTGTLRAEIYAGKDARDDAALRMRLEEDGLVATRPLGFENTYALGLLADEAERLGVRRVSDLVAHPDLAFGFTNEFLDRGDGWPGLRARYALPQKNVRGLDHDLAYRALLSGDVLVTDLYTTDAEIREYALRTLEDDLRYFPAYEAIVLRRADLDPRAAAALERLEGTIGAEAMIAMNARAKVDGVPEARVASDFLRLSLGLETGAAEDSLAARLLARTLEHLALVGIALAASVAVGVPLGVLGSLRPALGAALLGVAGVVQTIPSLALLVLLIPLLGIGAMPAIAALFLYGLLPIVRGTLSGLWGIPRDLRDSARALGLEAGARLRLVEMPLASPSILAGVRTAAVISVGTATLGALIGAGGYGQPILTGIRLARTSLLVEGAVPAAALALAVERGLALLERRLVSRGLRLSSQGV